MPVQSTFDSAKRLVVATLEGQVTVGDIVQYFETLKTNSGFDSYFAELVDLTKVVGSEVNFQSANMLARIDSFAHGARRAFAAPAGALFGIARMYQLLQGEETTIGVFESIREAKRWLGIIESEEMSQRI